MKRDQVSLTASRLRELLSYDPAIGTFSWKVRLSNRVDVGSSADAFNRLTGYISISIDGKLYRAHRLAWVYVHGIWPAEQLDHINGVRSDNRIANLREVTNRENQRNQRKAKRNTASGLLGVYRGKNGRNWRASIKTDAGQMHLGYFDTKEEAHAAYIAAKRIYHQSCTI